MTDTPNNPPPPKPIEASTVPATPTPGKTHNHPRRWIFWIVGIAIALLILIVGGRWIADALNTVSTDDAYVNGHVTFVAPRVPGQVMRVFVDDNNRVHKGDLLVQLDKEPYQVQLNIAQSAVEAANADLAAAQAQVRGLAGQTRGARFNLEHAIEDVDNQIALLRSKVATVASEKATLTKAQQEYDRFAPLVGSGAVSQQDMDNYRAALDVAKAKVEEALQGVYQVRVALGLPAKPEAGDDLTQVPADLNQTFSSVKQAQANLIQSASQLGVIISYNSSPRDMVAEFYKRDPQGNIDRIYEELFKTAPPVKQAESKLAQAKRNYDQAALNLSYCDVKSEIDGVVTRRDVNPGNNVIAGQSIMAVRSLTEIWVDANFKETQLASLKIGQSVDLDVDMYGSREKFKGRITGFTFGTGSTLALLPAENATGNFVKVVQRLPVRIDLIDYDPDKIPLFIGLSVTPSVYIKEPPTGPDAGKILQPYSATTTAPTTMP
jgi:membrane fusion protein (multidrug efflux system)